MSRDAVVLDTGGILALLNEDDEYHASAVSVFQQFEKNNRRFVTTDLVLAEVGNSLSRPAHRAPCYRFIRALIDDAHTDVVFVDGMLFNAALAGYHAHHDKTWGLVDCVSFEVMRASKSREAFTADRHFQQA
jgi:predicted nucleic acid-binding protein